MSETLNRTEDRQPDDQATRTVTEILMLLRRSGHDTLVAGAALGLVLAGMFAQMHTVRDLTDPLATIRVMLLATLVGALLRGAILLTLTNGRLLEPLGRLRRVSGAPLISGWATPLTRVPSIAPGEMRRQLHHLVAAVHRRCYLARGALHWSFASVAIFTIWTLMNVLSGASW
jgi:hypothetical protein